MKKKNSIILMFVVLITMFINVNSVMAKKVSCRYRSATVSFSVTVDTSAKTATINELSYCQLNSTFANINKCNNKSATKTVEYKYTDNSSGGNSAAYGSEKSNKKNGCPTNLNLTEKVKKATTKTSNNKKTSDSKKTSNNNKKTSDNNKKTSKKEEKITCYYRSATVTFHVIINKTTKKLSISEYSDCQINNDRYEDLNKCVEKSTTKMHEYNYIEKCDSSVDRTYDPSYISEKDNKKKGCPAKLCMSKISEDKVNEPKNAKTSDSSKMNETAKSLKFENKTGCNLWGGLLDTVKMIFTVIKWFLGVGLVILSMIDFAKAVIGSEPEEALAKAKKKLTTRIIVLIIIFLVPAILDLLLNNVLDIETCIDKIQ